MSHLKSLLAAFRAAHGRQLALGALLSILASVCAAGLLGLSGWFITATAIAGFTVGIAFEIFQPGAGIRAFALGRTASRYGERLVTHDATLRFLADVRGGLYRGLAVGPWSALGRLRRGEALSRLTADVDALDGFYLRLLLPVVAAIATLLIGFIALWALVALETAVAAIAPLALVGALSMRLAASRGAKAARRRLAALDAVRLRTIDLMSATPEYAAAGRLDAQRNEINAAAARAADAEATLRRLDVLLGAATAFAGDVAIAAALWTTLSVVGAPPEFAALAGLTAFGLLEAILPLRRGALEYGGLAHAARRIAPKLATPVAPAAAAAPPPRDPTDRQAGLVFEGVRFAYAPDRAAALDGFDLRVSLGDVVALEGASGSGKSTVLALAAGVARPSAGRVSLFGAPLDEWSEPALRRTIAYLPQRSELLGATMADVLRLSAPDAEDGALWAALEQVEMADAARAVGGLDARLGAGGVGFSGGESRRIALARVLLRRPSVVLLDEPTEGLGADQAARVLDRALARIEGAAVLIASHRAEERARADRVVKL